MSEVDQPAPDAGKVAENGVEGDDNNGGKRSLPNEGDQTAEPVQKVDKSSQCGPETGGLVYLAAADASIVLTAYSAAENVVAEKTAVRVKASAALEAAGIAEDLAETMEQGIKNIMHARGIEVNDSGEAEISASVAMSETAWAVSGRSIAAAACASPDELRNILREMQQSHAQAASAARSAALARIIARADEKAIRNSADAILRILKTRDIVPDDEVEFCHVSQVDKLSDAPQGKQSGFKRKKT